MSDSVSNPPSKSTAFSNAKIHAVWGSVLVSFGLLALWAYKSSIDGVIEGGVQVKEAGMDVFERGHKVFADDVKGVHDVAKKDLADLAGKMKAMAKAAAEKAEAVAAKFKEGTITQTFKSESPIFELNKVGRLEVAVAESVETFERKTEQSFFWNKLDLGDTVAEIKVPATFRYHLDLAEDWKIEIKDKCCIVHAPSLKPSLPVAFKTDGMERKSQSGWARFDAAEELEILERQITPKLNERASKPGHLKAAQREARDVVARFVRTWLLSADQWKDDRFNSITVLFAGEEATGVSVEPTLTIEMKP